MKKVIIIIAATLLSAVTTSWAGDTPVVKITDAHKQRAREIMQKMTLDEKIAYLSGKTAFSLQDYKHLGIPEIWLADGPQGIRNYCEHSTLYPSGIALAANWDHDMAHRYGESLGRDARARGVSILLGPGVNMYRSPRCGRNFEYFGEDPYLASETAVEYIKGVQSKGVISTIKHYAGNNQEWNRHHVGSNIDERTLHEIYLPTFRKAVQKAGVGAVMNSYNQLNGVHATENKWLNIDVLRDQWGFDGVLMSDWTSVYSTVYAANNGLDLEMPKAVYFTPEKLKAEIDAGRVTVATIDRKVEHLLSTFIAFGLLDREQFEEGAILDNPESRAVALDVARGGIVMLKNDDNVLPLKGTTVVLGPNCDIIPSGGGSGSVSPFSTAPLTSALKSLDKRTSLLTDDVLYKEIAGEIYADSTFTQRGFTGRYFDNEKLEYEPVIVRVDSCINFTWGEDGPVDNMPADYFSARWTAVYRPEVSGLMKIRVGGDDGYRFMVNDSIVVSDWGGHAYTSRETELEVVAGETYRLQLDYFELTATARVDCNVYRLDETLLAQRLKRADRVIYCTGFTGDTEGENFDRSFSLPAYQERFIRRLSGINPNVIVVLNAGGGVDMMPWIDNVKGLMMAWYPGQEGGQALAELLTGRLSPSGKLPVSIERRAEDNPTFNSYYANVNIEGETPAIDYTEGVFMGYRGYDKMGVESLFPFGYGLSYSTFKFDNMSARQVSPGVVDVVLDVTNTGHIEAAEVVQLYVKEVDSAVSRPEKELKGFAKIKLKPGETQRVKITLDNEAFAYYDIDRHQFVVKPGKFIIFAGNSSDNLPLQVIYDYAL